MKSTVYMNVQLKKKDHMNFIGKTSVIQPLEINNLLPTVTYRPITSVSKRKIILTAF